ncbi:MAG: DUF2865 domain-containing protein [Hyphomicrobiaceae bacterium]|nr:DUF2865 domain-containing protein [Hyphomicrobiaceae bacterium]
MDGAKTSARMARQRFLAVLAAVGLSLTVLAGSISTASAQGWWPWANDGPPRPREPVHRGPPPAPVPPPNALPPPGAQPQRGAGSSGSNICLQLEQRLVSEGQRGGQTRSQLPKLEDDIRQNERSLAQTQNTLERGDCYETFLFVKSLRQTPTCRNAAGQLESLKRRVGELNAQRQQMLGTGERSHQDEIIRELARNGCGNQYVQEARRRDNGSGSPFGGWQTEDDGPKTENKFGNLPFATYRTVCVRLCDGYFFPVSFSTLPNHFARDSDVCSSRCAAPAELYYHQNPGADMRQAVSAKAQTPYTSLRTAFKYTKELVQGCSCKEAEYLPPAGEKKAEGPGTSGATVSASPAQRGPALR